MPSSTFFLLFVVFFSLDFCFAHYLRSDRLKKNPCSGCGTWMHEVSSLALAPTLDGDKICVRPRSSANVAARFSLFISITAISFVFVIGSVADALCTLYVWQWGGKHTGLTHILVAFNSFCLNRVECIAACTISDKTITAIFKIACDLLPIIIIILFFVIGRRFCIVFDKTAWTAIVAGQWTLYDDVDRP